jgi:homoserine kinase type II
MAVYTEVSFDEAGSLVQSLGCGQLLQLRGIRAGIENTNYFVSTTGGEWVLTLFERLGVDALPFYLQLMKHLARRGIAAPEPQADAAGRLLHAVNGKPAALVNRLPGEHAMAPNLRQCEQVGDMLARLHLAAADFAISQPNPRGLDWCIDSAAQVLPLLDDERAALLRDELSFQRSLASSGALAALPRGVIHADLFCDNVVFDGVADAQRLSGIFDFFFAGVDCLLFDLAVCLNDWCIEPDSGRLVDERATALCEAYERVRTLHGAEHRLLPALLRATALRFWLSRLSDLHAPRDASLLQAHDPRHFERVLRERREHPWHALSA